MENVYKINCQWILNKANIHEKDRITQNVTVKHGKMKQKTNDFTLEMTN